MFGAAAAVCLVVLVISIAHAHVACNESSVCEDLLRPGSECIDGFCTNPFTKGGCLSNRLSDWKDQVRVCNSEDSVEAVERGYCRLPHSALDYMEIRIFTQNWESVFFEAWILQIVLSEILGVPTTLETGSPDVHLNLYDPQSAFGYGTSYDWEGLRRGNALGDCRPITAQRNHHNHNHIHSRSRKVISSDDEYQSCGHVIPEIWGSRVDIIREMEEEGVLDPAQGMGALAYQGWYVPRHTGMQDPTLLTHLGLSGEKNRRKLAETFLRPATWKDYCDEVSLNQCQTPDNITQRAPLDESEYDRYFMEGVYKGHFRKTDDNDCDKNPTTCTGHIAEYPCGWTSHVSQQAYHLNIAVKSNGKEPGSNGYSYSQLTQMWAAANATKSNILLVWWTPEALYQTYLNTEYEFQRVSLPPPTQDCIDSRISVTDRCSLDLETRVGSETGSCDDEPHILKKVWTSSLYDLTYNLSDPHSSEAQRSPAYDVIKAFSISALQLGKIFDYWLDRKIDTWNFDARDATCQWVVENMDFIQSFVPKTYPRVVRKVDLSHLDKLSYASLIVACFATLSVLVAGFCTYRLRNRQAMVYAQVEFLWILLVGLLMVAIGAIVLAVPPTDESCVASVWLLNVGYTLELVPLIIKVAAINRLINAAQRMRRVVLQRKSLFGSVMVLTMLVIVYMILWTVIDPPHRNIEYTLTDEVTADGEFVVAMNSYCHSDTEVWRFISASWHSLLLLWATVLAFQSRNLHHQVVETRTLAMMIYSHFFFVMLRLTIFILEDSLGVSKAPHYLSLIYSVDAVATLCIYFLPKFLSKDEASQDLEHYSNTFRSPERTRRVSLSRQLSKENPEEQDEASQDLEHYSSSFRPPKSTLQASLSRQLSKEDPEEQEDFSSRPTSFRPQNKAAMSTPCGPPSNSDEGCDPGREMSI